MAGRNEDNGEEDNMLSEDSESIDSFANLCDDRASWEGRKIVFMKEVYTRNKPTGHGLIFKLSMPEMLHVSQCEMYYIKKAILAWLTERANEMVEAGITTVVFGEQYEADIDDNGRMPTVFKATSVYNDLTRVAAAKTQVLRLAIKEILKDAVQEMEEAIEEYGGYP